VTDEQALALARLLRVFRASSASLSLGPSDLPVADVYVVVTYGTRTERTFSTGIAPDGSVSS